METQSIINGVALLGFSALGWFAKTLWNAVQELKNDLAKLREELPKEYVPKNDFKDAVQELKHLLIAISSKLDTKVDK